MAATAVAVLLLGVLQPTAVSALVVRSSEGVVVARCASFPIRLLAEPNDKPFHDTDRAITSILRALGHGITVDDATSPRWHEQRCGDNDRSFTSSASSGEGARCSARRPPTVTISTSACAIGRDRYRMLPPASIVVQLEPLVTSSVAPSWCCSPGNRTYFEGKVVWDYSLANTAATRRTEGICPWPGAAVEHMPFLAYSSPPQPFQYEADGRDTYDVVIVGQIFQGDRRHRLARALANAGLRVGLHGGLFDPAERSEQLRRVRVLVNVHRVMEYPEETPGTNYSIWPLETARLQMAMAAGLPVVSETSHASDMAGPAAAGAVVFAPYEGLVEAVVRLVRQPHEERRALAKRGYDYVHRASLTAWVQGAMQRAVRTLFNVNCTYGEDGTGETEY